MQRQHRFDEAGGTGGSLGVANLGFNRAQGAPGGTIAVAEHFAQRLNFSGVSNLGAGAVRFDEGYVARFDSGEVLRV